MFEYTDWIDGTGLSLGIREGLLGVSNHPDPPYRRARVSRRRQRRDRRAILGFARGVPLQTMLPFFQAMWLGFWINAVSGVLLLITYPTKALTNPLFYIKLTLIALVAMHARWVRAQIVGNPAFGAPRLPAIARVASAAALVCWAAAITTGRLLAYTYSYLMAYPPR